MRLADGVAEYVAHKRSTGLIYQKGESRLLAFSRSIGEVELHQVGTQQLVAYLDQFGVRSSESVAKYLLLSHFFSYWHLRGSMGALALPPKPARVRQTFVPYVFTSAEIRRLLEHIERSHRHANCLINAPTFRMFLILQYATGANVAELLLLRRCDVNLVTRRISFRGKCRPRDREIPIGFSLRQTLRDYVRGRFETARSTDVLFCDKQGRPIRPALATYTFNRLCETADVRRRDGSPRAPRLLDLKVTFAVRRLATWIKEGMNLNQMLPALAAYMGQAGLGATETYLRLTPERLKQPLDLLSPKTSITHWRDNPALMAFLAAL